VKEAFEIAVLEAWFTEQDAELTATYCRARWSAGPRSDCQGCAHAVGMISGLARFPIRPAMYFANWIVILVYARQVLAAGPLR
jgi:hypothetical protein